MGEVVILPVVRIERDAPTDGGKARIKARRAARNLSEPFTADDLRMDHVDNGMPSDSAYVAPDGDCA
jgi:hypothetical protein